MHAKFDMPHPATFLEPSPQLDKVISELEARTYPQPDDAVWRGDLPRELAVRLAKATGATDEQIAEVIAEGEAQPTAAEPEPEPEPEPASEPAPGCKRLTIRHTHEDGTLIHGTDKGDGVYELIGPRTAARFRFFPSIKMIGIPQSRDHLAKRWQIDQAAEALRKAGHVVTVEIDDTPREVTEVRADRAERLDARYDRLTTKAERQSAEAEARRARADQIAERFAGGQPILVGHHSERGARADQKRIDQNDRAANVAYRKAERAASAAAVVGREESRRQRPDVIIRRIAKTEAELRQAQHHIDGTRPANDWRGAYYAPEAKPASGSWLEQLTARKAYLEHQLAADRRALEEAKAAGYVQLSRETVHAGDLVTYWRSQRAEVVRVNPKTVSVRTEYTWTDKVSYEEIKSVECPHEDKMVTVTLPKPEPRRAAPVVTVERPAERPEPLRIDARFEFFPTPAGVAVRMATLADLYTDGAASMAVLEPSAGNGAIVAVAASLVDAVDCIELNGQLAEQLTRTGLARSVRCVDFLEVAAEPVYDRVLMNPPFANQADIKHVTHALGFLKPGGLLVAVMSAGAEFRTDKTAEQFRKLVADRGGRIDPLPADAFKQSGTCVRTIMATIPAAVVAEPEEGEPAGCSCCQTRSLAGQAHHECARCGHLGRFHVTCNMPPAQLTAMLSGTLF